MTIVLPTLGGILKALVQFAWNNPAAVLVAGAVLARQLGVVIQTGWKGVFFRFGRAVGELEPGFHYLIPFVHAVHQTPVRSITVELPKQRVMMADDLVYEVEVNVVYRVDSPTKALIQADDVHRCCKVVIPLITHEVLRVQTRESVADRERLDADLTSRLQARVETWGLVIEQAGFTSIAPTHEALRLTQMELRCRERLEAFDHVQGSDVSPMLALALLGSDRRFVARSAILPRARRSRRAKTVEVSPAEPSKTTEAVIQPTASPSLAEMAAAPVKEAPSPRRERRKRRAASRGAQPPGSPPSSPS